MKVILKMELLKELENIFIIIMIYMKENLKMEKKMEMEK